VEISLVRLLIEIDRPDPELNLLKIGSDIDHVIVGPHISEQANEATLCKLDELFGDADTIEVPVIKMFPDEDISRDAGDVLFDQ